MPKSSANSMEQRHRRPFFPDAPPSRPGTNESRFLLLAALLRRRGSSDTPLAQPWSRQDTARLLDEALLITNGLFPVPLLPPPTPAPTPSPESTASSRHKINPDSSTSAMTPKSNTTDDGHEGEGHSPSKALAP